jgi:hypothetical protein
MQVGEDADRLGRLDPHPPPPEVTVTVPTAVGLFRTDPLPTPPLPAEARATGPVTRAATRKLLAGLGTWAVLTTVLAWVLDGAWRTLALGLLLPGGGFLAHVDAGIGTAIVHVLLFVLSLLLVTVAYLTWVGTGNLIGVPIVWAALAGWAASMGGGHHPVWDGALVLVPVLTVLLAGTIALLVHRQHARAVARAPQVAAMLAAHAPTTAVTAVEPSGLPVVEASDPDTLALQRFLLDRALQPVEQFEGYDRLDQFREGAPRYQTCLSSYALSVHGYVHTPAFLGYATEAQHRFGRKMQDHHVWGYWRVENFWGRLHLDPDPVAVNNNIMWTGWYAGMLGMLETAQEDASFSAPGGVELRHPRGRTSTYDYDAICENLLTNFRASAFTLFPCEPGWTYPMCNNFGAIGLIAADRLHGTDRWARVVEDYRRRLEQEFVTADGNLVAVRHTVLGMSVTPMNSTMPGCMASLYMNAVFPDLARRSYEIVRDRAFHLRDGVIDVDLSLWDLIDFGNYKPSRFSSYAMLAAAAREHGDHEAADALLARLEADRPLTVVDGVGHHADRSVGAHATAVLARSLRANGLHDLVNVGKPEAWRTGPVLAAATYPEVLVARAVSDGTDLDLTLDPGRPGPVRTDLGLGRLRPATRYTVTTDGPAPVAPAEVVADATGAATLTVDLAARTRLRLVPAGV